MAHETRREAGWANLGAIRRRLLAWYRQHKRDLPWRRTGDPYRIWISEIMLQQTRVAAVLPYYARFLELFPDVQALAGAPDIVEAGEFPRTYSSLRELPGVGDYTAAAVASIAFGLPHALVDGNVARVMSRLAAEAGDIKSEVVRRWLRALAELLLDRKHPGEFNQALMELGATVCVPKRPLCESCPVRMYCEARKQGLELRLPVRGARGSADQREKKLLVIEKGGEFLFWQRTAESSRLADFWELPEREQLPHAKVTGYAGVFRHTIVNTTYLVEVSRATVRSLPSGFRWLAKSSLQNVPVSTTAKKALAIYSRSK